MDNVKVVNGHQIKLLSRNEINKELIANGDWSIDYYVPGRIIYPYFITINRKRYRFSNLAQIEKFCKMYKKSELKDKEQYEINKLIRGVL